MIPELPDGARQLTDYEIADFLSSRKHLSLGDMLTDVVIVREIARENVVCAVTAEGVLLFCQTDRSVALIGMMPGGQAWRAVFQKDQDSRNLSQHQDSSPATSHPHQDSSGLPPVPDGFRLVTASELEQILQSGDYHMRPGFEGNEQDILAGVKAGVLGCAMEVATRSIIYTVKEQHRKGVFYEYGIKRGSVLVGADQRN